MARPESAHPPVPSDPRIGSLAALLVVILGCLVASPSSAQVRGQRARVEGVAAWVGGTGPGSGSVVVLRSDVELRARLRLSGRMDRLPTAPLPRALLAVALDEIVGEVLIALEADRLRAARPGASDIERERAQLSEQAGGAARLTELMRFLGADRSEIDAIAERRAYVDGFLRANLEGSTVVSDAQVQRAYDAGEHPFVGRPLDDVREVLRAWLAREILERDVRRWVEVLRSRTPVRVVARWQDG